MERFKSYDELPLTLDAKDISKFLGVSPTSCYSLFKRKDFPTIKIGKRSIVARDKFLMWLEQHTQTAMEEQ